MKRGSRIITGGPGGAQTCRVEGVQSRISSATSAAAAPRQSRRCIRDGSATAPAGDAAKAKAEYQNFFTLWKDADPDIPILKEAKAESAKLQ